MNNYEILSPAGTFETFKSVLNAGADAVYLGGSMFGARAYAGNFTDEEVLEAIAHAHVHGKKVYMTVNTLMKNTELFRNFYAYLAPFYEAGLDAVIVQDFGVMKFVEDQFPGLDIHASTQMTVTDASFAKVLTDNCQSLTRIVPARELTLPELQALHGSTSLELETFVHGALCYCYSGQCLMSSMIGGRSGNRGRCAQPCRLVYEKDNKESTLLSLKDLSTIEILPDILEAGVFSLKIEGRMKSTEYAAGITSIYRKYLDLYMEKGRSGYTVSKEDLDHLLLLFDRGGITKGYYVMHNGKNMITTGVKSDKSQQEKKAFEDDILNRYRDTEHKEKINGHVTLLKNSSAILTVTYGDDTIVTAEGEAPQKAQNRAMSREDIVKQLSKFGNTPFVMDDLAVTMEDDIFISNKALNELRREVSEKLLEALTRGYHRTLQQVHAYDFPKNSPTTPKITARTLDAKQAKAAIALGIDRVILECELLAVEEMTQLLAKGKEAGVTMFFSMPRIMRSSKDSFSKMLPALLQAGFDGCLIRSLSQLEILKSAGFKGEILSDYNVYGMNDLSCQFLLDTGVHTITYPLELNEKELGHLKNPQGEMLVYGRIPLMVSAGCVDKNTTGCHHPHSGFSEVKDRKAARLPVLCACGSCYNVIYSHAPLDLRDKTASMTLKQARYLACSFTTETAEQVTEILSGLQKALQGAVLQAPEPESFTRGHFNRGVE